MAQQKSPTDMRPDFERKPLPGKKDPVFLRTKQETDLTSDEVSNHPTVTGSVVPAVTSAEDATKALRKPKTVDGVVYYPFYHFPYIVAFRGFARLKLYQTGLTGIMAVGMTTAHLMGMNVSQAAVASAVVVNAVAMLALLGMGQLFQRWIGRMYLDETGQHVLISHLTFFGRRRDVVMRTADVMPLEEVATDAYVKFRRFDRPNETFYYSLVVGGVLDEEAFKYALGTVPVTDLGAASAGVLAPIRPPPTPGSLLVGVIKKNFSRKPHLPR
ncbi:hypothetical protein BV898_14280 [Hypsibius exemplaris]|uniref:Transmembrane protein 186 n=1 Tax=Hypsibius exemplaris TaxID=2072580 RepID=A0A1W0W891_HYPEX|nr:hypothetical protein BV898_14280 [Hypsibius exemplaris]